MRMFDIVLTVIIELARIFITLEYFRIFLDCESRFKEMLAGLLAFLLTTGCICLRFVFLYSYYDVKTWI